MLKNNLFMKIVKKALICIVVLNTLLISINSNYAADQGNGKSIDEIRAKAESEFSRDTGTLSVCRNFF